MSESESVEDRLAYLEDQNEGLKRLGVMLLVLVLVLGGSVFLQNRSMKTALSSEGLILNSGGQPRSAITPMPNGHLGMVFYDFKGNLPQAQFSGLPYLDGLVFYDKQGKPRILMGLDEADNPVLALLAPDGKILFSPIRPTGAQPGAPGGGPPTAQPGATGAAAPPPAGTPAPATAVPNP